MRKIFVIFFMLFMCNICMASLPYNPISFPRDEGAHFKNVPYQFKQLIEWWYFNGKLTTDDGRHFAYDIAFFNAAVQFNNVMTQPMLHLQLSDLDQKKAYGVAKMYPINAGRISTDKLDIYIEDYTIQKTLLNETELYYLKAKGKQGDTTLEFNLLLEPVTEPLLINKNGLVPMPDDTNSYYYSIPRFKTTGNIVLNDTNYIVSQPGDSWMDHQWGDFSVRKNGWEWFGIRLENGLLANIFLNINFKNNSVIGGVASIILPNGETQYISYKDFKVIRDDFWFDEKLSVSYPMKFTLTFPELGLEINNLAAFPEQEVNGYWEGFCNVNAVYNKNEIKGFSFMELVYSAPTPTQIR